MPWPYQRGIFESSVECGVILISIGKAMKILITGVAGFIGMHVANRLLKEGYEVVGLDNLNNYYDVRLKQSRVKYIGHPNQFSFLKSDIADSAAIFEIVELHKPQVVINLAAQAGVRFSIEAPMSYVNSNLVGFANVLEACRHHDVGHLIYASSSSVYGLNESIPFNEEQNVDHPLALYGATKRANELLAHSYSNLFGLPTTGLRFFTVYGPWGRPDMALFKFTESIIKNKPIDVFNHGQMVRDFTYIDDIVESIFRLVSKPATPNPDFSPNRPDAATSSVPWRLFNIGNGTPTSLMSYIEELETCLGMQATKNFLDMQPGDVKDTSADTQRLSNWIGFRPNTPVKVGVKKFVDWYTDYYGVRL